MDTGPGRVGHFCAGDSPEGVTVIRIGSPAAGRSPWIKVLNEVAADWERTSNGTVHVRIHAVGIAGKGLDMIRRMDQGTLDGDVLFSLGLFKIHRDLLALGDLQTI